MSTWHVYLLHCSDNTLYCGITTDVPRRLDQHNGLRPGGAKCTRARRPVTLCASRPCADKSEALRLERHIKSLPRARKIESLHHWQAAAHKEEKA